MNKRSMFHLMYGPAESSTTAESVVKAIPGIVEKSGYDGITTSEPMQGQVILRAGPLDVFFRVVHGLTGDSFVQFGYQLLTVSDGMVSWPVDEWPTTDVAHRLSTPQQIVVRELTTALEAVVDSIIKRYGPDARIRDGAVIEPVPDEVPA